MPVRQICVILLCCSALAGCGGGADDAITDPARLKPLTDAEKAGIKKQDEDVASEEGQSIKFDKKKN